MRHKHSQEKQTFWGHFTHSHFDRQQGKTQRSISLLFTRADFSSTVFPLWGKCVLWVEALLQDMKAFLYFRTLIWDTCLTESLGSFNLLSRDFFSTGTNTNGDNEFAKGAQKRFLIKNFSYLPRLKRKSTRFKTFQMQRTLLKRTFLTFSDRIGVPWGIHHHLVRQPTCYHS